ncbi:MAG: WGxxGxxG-CTERM domain-containing protein [Acidimicrobiia bacterium]|nr:WGxxGxxG-CTERM domain-containing protein [Acidimicrobiia bacterium]
MKKLGAVLLVSSLTLAAPAVAYAQETPAAETEDEGDDSGKYGLLGLLGLAGLAGLKRRNDPYDRERTTGTTGQR